MRKSRFTEAQIVAIRPGKISCGAIITTLVRSHQGAERASEVPEAKQAAFIELVVAGFKAEVTITGGTTKFVRPAGLRFLVTVLDEGRERREGAE